MLKTSLCNYSDAYILVNWTITITAVGEDDGAKQLDGRNKGVIFKNCATFTDCISEISNAQIDNAKYLDVVMLMYNLINTTIIIRKYQEVCGNVTEMIPMII